MFADVSDAIEHNPPREQYGVAVVDFSGRGQLEFAVAANRAPNRLLRWTRGKLRDVAPPIVADVNAGVVLFDGSALRAALEKDAGLALVIYRRLLEAAASRLDATRMLARDVYAFRGSA